MFAHALTICLFLLLPLQTTWAAVAPYCQHEIGIAAEHFGHHEHEHEHDHDQSAQNTNPSKFDNTVIETAHLENTAADLDVAPPAAADGVHADCATCHSSCGAAILVATAEPIRTGLASQLVCSNAYTSDSTSDRPERPNWSSPA